jgi:hypothetical protein
MTTKPRKRKRFTATQAVKAASRERLGSPKPTRRLPDEKKLSPPKHKPTLGRLLSEE